MNFKIILTIFLVFLLNACNNYDRKQKNIKNDNIKKYKNSGFALIYEKKLKIDNKISKKMNNDSLIIFHNSLKKDSLVKITNPINQKSIIAKVISNDVNFPEVYNSVITHKIAEELNLNKNEPYVDLILITKDSTFIAKKAKTFDEEKKIAEKAPIDGIVIDNLGTKEDKNDKIKKRNFNFSIKVADFYYKDSAKNMVNRIKNETKLKNYLIKKLSKTKYRVLLGPFDDIKKLEESFNEIKSLNFENLEILKDV